MTYIIYTYINKLPIFEDNSGHKYSCCFTNGEKQVIYLR